MTPDERKAAAYYVGDTAKSGREDQTRALGDVRRAVFLRLQRGRRARPGASAVCREQRRYELFGKAKQILRRKLAEWLGDRTLDQHATGGRMIDYGYRIYDGLDGRLHFDQIVAGRVYPLQPTDDDEKLPRGFYAPDFTYLGDDGISDVADWTRDVDWDDDWEESKHPRGQPENKGEFAKGGGGGGGGGGKRESFGKSYVRAGETGEKTAAGVKAEGGKQAKEAVNKIAGKAFKTIKGALGAEDYEIVHEHFKAAKSKPKERAKIGGYLRQMAKAGKNLAKAHLKEEAHHAKHAVGALRALATGTKPTKQQAMGLFSYGARALMITGSMALGDPTGHSGALAATFAEDAVHHVLLEHAVKLFVGGGYGLVKGSIAKPETDADPGDRPDPDPADDDDTDVDTDGEDGEDGEMSDEDAALLQKFLECLADTVEDMTEEDAMRVLAQGETPDEDEDGDDDPDGDDDGEPQAKGEESDDQTRDVDPWWTADIEWDPAEHPRVPGGRVTGGQFTAGGGGGGGRARRETGKGAGAGHTFVSPSVHEDLDFGSASAGLRSERQKMLETAANEIDTALGLRSRHRAAIGAWSDGAENTVMTETDGGSWEALKLAAAMKAHPGEPEGRPGVPAIARRQRPSVSIRS